MSVKALEQHRNHIVFANRLLVDTNESREYSFVLTIGVVDGSACDGKHLKQTLAEGAQRRTQPGPDLPSVGQLRQNYTGLLTNVTATTSQQQIVGRAGQKSNKSKPNTAALTPFSVVVYVTQIIIDAFL